MEIIRRYVTNGRIATGLRTPVFKKYLENASWLIFEKIFSLFVAMVVSIYVARYLQPEQFGLLNYAISFVGIFASFSTLGLDQIIVRELSKDPERAATILGTGFVLKLAGASCLCVIVLLALPAMNSSALTNSLILIIASAELLKCFDVVNNYYQARVESKYIVQVQLGVNLLSSALKVLFVYLGAPLIFFAWIVLLNACLNAGGYAFNYYKREGSLLRWTPDRTIALRLLREAWPLAVHGIALLTQARIDQVMLGKMIGNAVVGQYAVAMRFIEMFSFVPIILLNTFLPAVTRARQISRVLYENRLVNLYRLMFFMFIVLAVPIFLFGRPVIVFLYGQEYEVAGILLSLFAIRLFFTNMGVAKSVFTINESLFRFSLLATLIGASFNIAINYLLIPLYGPYGSLVATVVSFTISDFVVDMFYDVTRANQNLIFKGIFSFWKMNQVFPKL